MSPCPSLASLTRLAFLTLPNYSLIAVSAAVEALRMANYVAGEEVYRWQVATLTGEPAQASGGLSLSPTVALRDAAFDVLFVCGGVDVRRALDRRTVDELRRLARRGLPLGALCTGTFALAEAGLLDGYRCAIHWENLAAIREEFAEISFAEDLFVIDRDRFTCTGGSAPLDLMGAFIEARLGRDAAERMSEQFVLERLRGGAEPQHPPLRHRGHGHPALEQAAALMTKTIGAPLAIAVIAARVGLSARQLERLFRLHVGMAPAEFSMALRLDHARELLRQSDLAVTAVGVACGFVSSAHFSSAYRRRFGHAPRAERAAVAPPRLAPLRPSPAPVS
ncbi:GlxA family transcriptional regulator [Aureimonas pseudogalii]|uniref:Transcriptional regulator GlxA family with amidase domain n=1 Tax=Aureimonas pseudogalii TaxID=1744844 RepID=A0A7W6EB42_9HYPH|nr:GlxA family transcriptional regulator [Aureimonas pseudogalii]MBB3998091.1 transcriptional regulator GlxA family with amidase domain [Aureimonas pseudogalii]